MRLLHTSDWQIGKSFASFPEEARGVLSEARIAGIRKIGSHAAENGIGICLVAGDIYDIEDPGELTLGRPLEAMAAYPVQWHLIPGNHDSAQREGVWPRALARGLPANVNIHLEPKPVELSAGAWLLPCPLPRRRTRGDLTEWMDGAATPDGAIRIGIGHGPIHGFSEGEMQENLINPGRARSAGLDYLALGDWHSGRRIDARTWYSGTHETDRFKPIDGGTASGGGEFLSVTITHHGAEPQVDRCRSGKFTWHQFDRRLLEAADVGAFAEEVARVAGGGDVVARIKASGALPLSAMAEFDRAFRTRLAASVFHLEIDDEGLVPAPTDDDFDSIDVGGFVRAAAERLRDIASGSDAAKARIARMSLARLYAETAKAGGDA